MKTDGSAFIGASERILPASSTIGFHVSEYSKFHERPAESARSWSDSDRPDTIGDRSGDWWDHEKHGLYEDNWLSSCDATWTKRTPLGNTGISERHRSLDHRDWDIMQPCGSRGNDTQSIALQRTIHWDRPAAIARRYPDGPIRSSVGSNQGAQLKPNSTGRAIDVHKALPGRIGGGANLPGGRRWRRSHHKPMVSCMEWYPHSPNALSLKLSTQPWR